MFIWKALTSIAAGLPLLESCATRGVAPYKNVVTYGFTMDEKAAKCLNPWVMRRPA